MPAPTWSTCSGGPTPGLAFAAPEGPARALARRPVPRDRPVHHDQVDPFEAGIGFTVALFISELAFESPARQAEAKLAILAASLVSALVAVAVLLTVDQESDGDSARSNARLFMQ